jgi:hypothetical protein
VSLHPCVPGSPTATSRGLGTQVRHAVPLRRGVPIIDCHECVFPGKRHRIAPAWVFLGLLVPGEGPRGHEILHHLIGIELVLDGVRLVRAGLFEKSLEVARQRSCLMFATARGGSNALHVGAAHFLIVVVVAVSRVCNPLRVPLLPLLAALGILDGDARWHRFDAVEDCFPTA